jgi:hypothetical protein
MAQQCVCYDAAVRLRWLRSASEKAPRRVWYGSEMGLVWLAVRSVWVSGALMCLSVASGKALPLRNGSAER